MDAMVTNITNIFLVAMVNMIAKAPDVPMLTFDTTVIKVINVNWFPLLPEISGSVSLCRNFLSSWKCLGYTLVWNTIIWKA